MKTSTSLKNAKLRCAVSRFLLSAAMLLVVSPVFAQHAETSQQGADAVEQAVEHPAEAADHDDEASHHGHGYHPNEVALFAGVTDEEDHGSEFTLGVDYERRLSQHWGIGGLIDWAGGDLRNTVFAVPVFWHPGGNWKLIGAPGIEYHNGRGDVVTPHKSEGHDEVDEDETNFLIRFGVAYDIHLGGSWGLAPALNIDLVDSERVWVYGLDLTYGW